MSAPQTEHAKCLAKFWIGCEFRCGDRLYRCTDVGTRTLIAICIDPVDFNGTEGPRRLSRAEAERQGWFNGPPFASAELVFDEYDLPVCHIIGHKAPPTAPSKT